MTTIAIEREQFEALIDYADLVGDKFMSNWLRTLDGQEPLDDAADQEDSERIA